MCGVVLAMHGLVMAICKDSDGAIGLRGFESRLLNGRSKWHLVKQVVGGLLFQQRAGTLASMVATTTLLLGHSHQMLRVSVTARIILKSCLGALLGLTEVDAFLLWMMDLVLLTTITLDMRRSFLALKSTMMTLCNRTALFRHQGKLSVGMVATADSMAFQTRAAGPFGAVGFDDHDDKLEMLLCGSEIRERCFVVEFLALLRIFECCVSSSSAFVRCQLLEMPRWMKTNGRFPK
jgi:hypothetical protein